MKNDDNAVSIVAWFTLVCAIIVTLFINLWLGIVIAIIVIIIRVGITVILNSRRITVMMKRGKVLSEEGIFLCPACNYKNYSKQRAKAKQIIICPKCGTASKLGQFIA